MSDLFSELKIGSMTLKNRTFMSPITLGYDDPSGNPSSKEIAYWTRRAQGEVGCIITDVTSVDPNVPYLGNTLCFRSEQSIAAHKEFTDRIHSYNCRVIPQLSHPGPESISSFMGITPLAPSDGYNSMGQKVRAISIDEIHHITNQYAQTALNIKKAGYDGIELHCAHAYMLLGSFLSPRRNKRNDEYGGSLFNRARFLFEVIDAIKETCGKDFPIILRISGSEKIEGGNTLEDTKTLVPYLIEHGIDAFEISGGSQYEMPNKIMPSHGESQASNLKEAIEIKKISSVPVLLVGKINEPQLARDLMNEVDGIVIGRALLADPDFVLKTKEHKDEQIAPCAACLVGCVGQQSKRLPGSCVMNPFVGKEDQMKLEPAQTIKKVAVIGGGIAGMAASRYAQMRGHKVTLFEKSNELGGQINLASLPPHKQELQKWIQYLKKELNRLDVEIKLNVEVDESILNEDYDAYIVATGSNPISLQKGKEICTAHEYLKGDFPIESGNVLIVGGGMVGLETALALQSRAPQTNITVIEMAPRVGMNVGPANLVPLLQELKAELLTDTKLEKYENEHATLKHKEEMIVKDNIDYLIYAIGSKSNQTLYEKIKDSVSEIYLIGDASNPAQALDATAQAVQVALTI